MIAKTHFFKHKKHNQNRWLFNKMDNHNWNSSKTGLGTVDWALATPPVKTCCQSQIYGAWACSNCSSWLVCITTILHFPHLHHPPCIDSNAQGAQGAKRHLLHLFGFPCTSVTQMRTHTYTCNICKDNNTRYKEWQTYHIIWSYRREQTCTSQCNGLSVMTLVHRPHAYIQGSEGHTISFN